MRFSWLRAKRWRAHAFAAAFELGMLASAGLAVTAAYAITEPAARDTSVTVQARVETQNALDAAIRRAAPHEAHRLRDFLVSAIDAGEIELARGVMLSHGDASLRDEQRIARFVAALPLASQQAFSIAQEEAAAPLAPRQAAVIVTPNSQGSGVHTYTADTLQALAATAQQWRAGQPVDEFGLMLSGFDQAVGRAPEATQLLKIARRAGKLDPAYESHWRAMLLRALPPARLRATLAATQADPHFPIRIPEAFRQSLNGAAAQALHEELATLRAIQNAAATPGALVLVQHIRAPADSARLRLAAMAGGDRATALALLSGREALLRTVPGKLVITPQLTAISALLWAALALTAIGGIGAIACELTAKTHHDPLADFSPLPASRASAQP